MFIVDLQSSFKRVWVFAEGQRSLPHPRVVRRRTIHRLASEVENTKRHWARNRQLAIHTPFAHACRNPVAETTQNRPQALAKVSGGLTNFVDEKGEFEFGTAMAAKVAA